jgi:hypothetical protein
MPSMPAISCTANARYGLPEASGARNSMRFAFGFVPVIGMRMDAERLPAEYTRLTGASNPGMSRWYELTVGFVNAASERACLRMPPMYQRAMSDRPPYPFSS